MTSKLSPTLPQQNDAKLQQQRLFDLSLARTQYNYTFSYMAPLSLAASVPKDEEFTPDYFIKVLQAFWGLADNFVDVVADLLLKELSDDYSIDELKVVREFLRLSKDLKNSALQADQRDELLPLFARWLACFVKVPPAIVKQFFIGNKRLPKELFMMLKGLIEVFNQFREEGFTAFLKSTLFEMLDYGDGREYLDAKSLADYQRLYDDVPEPFTLKIPHKSWMKNSRPEDSWDQDWYLGFIQIAGFNTTNLRAVTGPENTRSKSLALADLLAKMPLTDDIFQQVSGSALSLAQAAAAGHLFACDYAMIDGIAGSKLNGKQRYPVAPIALFFYNTNPPEGYPPEAAMQPIAIQIQQQYDVNNNPIFTPGDVTANNDSNGVKWRLAKAAVQNACAVQHETVAHLGACHLVIDPMIIAANRQLHVDHPLMVLLKPHFRYTLPINNGAYNSLIVPGGVVSSVVSSTLEGSTKMIVDAHAKWGFDEQIPTRLFTDRGVDADQLADFPFRDDSLDVWTAIHEFVGSYLAAYYGADSTEAEQAMLADVELQAWINEMVNSRCAATQGMAGLSPSNVEGHSVQLDNFSYFVDTIALIIYTASAQHASVNYAQYPMMTYIPSVSGTLYRKPPTADMVLEEADYISWLPPLDVALYQISFGHLLSSVQYDQLGHYDRKNQRYFTDQKIQPVVARFQQSLSRIEATIEERNKQRAFAYEMQLPSKIPNSISI